MIASKSKAKKWKFKMKNSERNKNRLKNKGDWSKCVWKANWESMRELCRGRNREIERNCQDGNRCKLTVKLQGRNLHQDRSHLHMLHHMKCRLLYLLALEKCFSPKMLPSQQENIEKLTMKCFSLLCKGQQVLKIWKQSLLNRRTWKWQNLYSLYLHKCGWRAG